MPANTPFSPVSGPRFTPLKYGLLSAAEVIDDGDSHWRAGTQFQPDPCGSDRSVAAFCIAGGPATGTPTKVATATGAPSSAAEAFTVYAFTDCAPVGWGNDLAEYRARAERHLDRGEARAVEHVFWTGVPDGGPTVYPHLASDTQVFADPQGANTVELQSAADALPAVTGVVGAMGEVEGALGECYGGEGVIHVPAAAVAYLVEKSLAVPQGPVLRSPTGHKIAVYSSNDRTAPDGSTPAAGAFTFYATGAVMARRGAVQGGQRPADFVDKRKNGTVYVVERTFSLDWDCCHFAVQVTP